MALNIQRLITSTPLKNGLFGVEVISLAYSALTTLLILFFYMRMDHPGEQLVGRICIVGMTLVLYTLYRRYPCRLTTMVRVVAQLFLLAYWYPDTYEFNRLFPNLDHLFASWEQLLFGCQPALVFSEVCHTVWWSEAFNLGYWTYYPMMFLVVFYYFFARYEGFMRTAFVLLCSFFIYYLIYLFLPVTGPQYYFQAISPIQAAAGCFPDVGDYFLNHSELMPNTNGIDGFFYRMVESTQASGERPTAAFPSSHVGISTIMMMLLWQANRRLTLCIAPFYLLLCGATVYIQAHYLIDALAGLVSALPVYWISTRLYKVWSPF